jgi:hypothetical protein
MKNLHLQKSVRMGNRIHILPYKNNLLYKDKNTFSTIHTLYKLIIRNK